MVIMDLLLCLIDVAGVSEPAVSNHVAKSLLAALAVAFRLRTAGLYFRFHRSLAKAKSVPTPGAPLAIQPLAPAIVVAVQDADVQYDNEYRRLDDELENRDIVLTTNDETHRLN